jgi:hypothetical protein
MVFVWVAGPEKLSALPKRVRLRPILVSLISSDAGEILIE